MEHETDLHDGELEILGRITSASNATFLGSIGGTMVVYKPVAGERPLWDFPDGDLADAVPDHGWRPVFEGTDGHDRCDAHPRGQPGASPDGRVRHPGEQRGPQGRPHPGHGRRAPLRVDHGLTFHVEHKLRTILWGWLGEQVDAGEREGIDRARCGLAGDLGEALAGLLSEAEVSAFAARCDRLRSAGRFPAPHGTMPPMPWPLF